MLDLNTLPAPELVPLFRGTWRMAEYRTVGTTPAGTRMIIEMPEGRIEGDRLQGRVVGATTSRLVSDRTGRYRHDQRSRFP